MNFRFFPLVALLLMGFRAGTPLPKEYIPWNADHPVQWKDFKGKPQNNAKEAAMTASSIEFNYVTNGVNMVRWNVYCKFYPELSWSRKEKQNMQVLNHERLHFDITEVYSRIMRKRFLEEIKSVKDIPKIKTIGKAVMTEWNKEEEAYDQESEHSMNTAKQQEWNQAVAERLEELKDYTMTSFTVKK